MILDIYKYSRWSSDRFHRMAFRIYISYLFLSPTSLICTPSHQPAVGSAHCQPVTAGFLFPAVSATEEEINLPPPPTVAETASPLPEVSPVFHWVAAVARQDSYGRLSCCRRRGWREAGEGRFEKEEKFYIIGCVWWSQKKLIAEFFFCNFFLLISDAEKVSVRLIVDLQKNTILIQVHVFFFHDKYKHQTPPKMFDLMKDCFDTWVPMIHIKMHVDIYIYIQCFIRWMFDDSDNFEHRKGRWCLPAAALWFWSRFSNLLLNKIHN